MFWGTFESERSLIQTWPRNAERKAKHRSSVKLLGREYVRNEENRRSERNGHCGYCTALSIIHQLSSRFHVPKSYKNGAQSQFGKYPMQGNTHEKFWCIKGLQVLTWFSKQSLASRRARFWDLGFVAIRKWSICFGCSEGISVPRLFGVSFP